MHRLMTTNGKRTFHARRGLPGGADALVGGITCALAALGASAVAAGHSWQVWMPLLFSAVLFLIALIFGTRAGLLGTILATLVFALFLFSPTGKINVADQAARANLGWMTLTGFAFSLLFAPPSSRFPHH